MHVPIDINSTTPALDLAGALPGGQDVLHMGPVDSAEFRAIMARHLNEGAAGAGPEAGPGASHGKSLGARIIERATGLSEEVKQQQHDISKQLERASHSGNPMEMVKAMVALHDYQQRVQVIAKVASKATSALDQLTKLQ